MSVSSVVYEKIYDLAQAALPEPEEWSAYVQKGDQHPKKPVWDLPQNHSRPHHEELKLGQRRLSAKDKAHMDFIKSGKSFRK